MCGRMLRAEPCDLVYVKISMPYIIIQLSKGYPMRGQTLHGKEYLTQMLKHYPLESAAELNFPSRATAGEDPPAA